MSVRQQIRDMGAKKVDDLISTMMEDHEQATRVISCNHVTPMPSTNHNRRHSAPKPEKSPPSLVSRLWRSKTVTEDIAVHPAPLAIKQTHWKPTATASKCANPLCRKLFSSVLDRRRNCSMCGLVFCQKCTNYNRRLSSNAQPNPLGLFYSVCQICFNFHNAFGGVTDHMREFQTVRQTRINSINHNEAEQQSLSLCLRGASDDKKLAMSKELERLMSGYKNNQGAIKGLVSEMMVPAWQKSPDWVVSKNVSKCLNCGSDFSVMRRKLHCRIGGQIFCSNCATDELILYMDDKGDVRWALNGKDGGPTKEPNKFCLVTICLKCSSELLDMITTSLSAPPPSVFLDSLNKLHSSLSKLKTKIEADLPSYKQLVDCMDMKDESPKDVKDKHPMRRLIKAHSDLSDAFSTLAVESQKLKLLKPKTHPQEKLLRNVMMGVYRFYSDNMYSFRNLKNHLAELIPMDTLAMMQMTLSQQTLEKVHVVVQQLVFEALNLEHKYKFDNEFFTPIINVTKHMDVEFKEFLEGKDESWENHNKLILRFIEEEMKAKHHRIKINEEVLRYNQPQVIHYIVVSQCSSIIHECYRELQAKTIDREFKKVKESLHNACEKLDIILVCLNAIV